MQLFVAILGQVLGEVGVYWRRFLERPLNASIRSSASSVVDHFQQHLAANVVPCEGDISSA